jgi:hypothetical protein
MAPRGFFVAFALLFSSLGLPAAAIASSGAEISPVQTWTLAGALPSDEVAPAVPRSVRAWQVTFTDNAVMPPGAQPLDLSAAAAEQRPIAFVYSEGYNTRRKIHMAASYATIPLFVAQYLVGQDLYDGGASESAKSAHGALTVGIASLFAVNTVTGAWNWWEARKDPNGKTRRLIHSLMMFGADLGFVATGALAPDDDEDGGSSSDKSLHRNVAITSMGVAVASYVYMLVTR